ncbi:nucleotidyltransferase [Lactobacillus sp. UCMA15818]|uniref:nucleotidyltransferase n=1 Tax=Lactobacillus sp. UCMA15818 TaxID=2583394 RepID=UPI0025B0A109|nr:nucleotidyltransferase [Lactobacillus sp. UCMA15818]MDN2452622.1 nucleotidyltransferase [Lactobacillus sp. UCMA15818]
MDIVGIVTEYNPLHNGHLYQINEVKKRFPNAVIVVVMSGNFLERGEPAILDKWTRAKEAILSGINLVVELPVAFCVQPADFFAFGALRILKELGVQKLVFGVENADYDFAEMAQLTKRVHGDFSIYNESYAKAYQRAITQKTGVDVSEPNNLLGLAYAKANLKLGSFLELIPIQRKSAEHHDRQLPVASQIASASAIRSAVLTNKELVIDFVPDLTGADLRQSKKLSWVDFWPLLKYQVLTSKIEDLSEIYGITEGLEFRLKDKLERMGPTVTFADWVSEVKSKRFTYTHLTRLATMILLQAKKEEVEQVEQNPYIRILGFDSLGQKHLNMIKKKMTFPVVSRVSQEIAANLLSLDYRAGLVYSQISGQRQDFGQSPFQR